MFIGQYDTQNINFSRRKSAKEKRKISLGLKSFWDKKGRKQKPKHTKRNVALALGGLGLIGAGVYGAKKLAKNNSTIPPIKIDKNTNPSIKEEAIVELRDDLEVLETLKGKKASNRVKVNARKFFLEQEARDRIPSNRAHNNPEELKDFLRRVEQMPGVNKKTTQIPLETNGHHKLTYREAQRRLGKINKRLAKDARKENRYFSRYLI